MKKFLFIFPLLLLPLFSKAAIIFGNITDIEKQPLAGVTLSLFTLPDTIQKNNIISAENGDFKFDKLSEGKYLLKASMVGMDEYERNIEINKPDQIVDLGRIEMAEKGILLQEAVVSAIKTAIVAKQDTLEYNAGSFHTSTNATVDELLKKLPGVEVGSDGSITANGKSITKILVDGKEFFSDDPQMASKNLPSNMVDKIQVIDKKSDLAKLTGVDDGEEETVINLTVKKDMKNGWFGNVSAGYGTDNRYQGSFVVNHFYNGNQITFLGGANNVNEMGFSDRGGGRFRNAGGNGGINTSQRIGMNFNIGKDELIRFGGNVFYSHSDRKYIQDTSTQFLLPDSVSYQDAYSSSNDRGNNVNADFRLQWNIDENNTIDFRPRATLNFRRSNQADSSLLRAGDPFLTPVNKNLNSKYNKGTSYEFSGNLIYNHKFKSRPGRSFSINFQYSFSNVVQKLNTLNLIEYYLLEDTDEDIFRYIDDKNLSNSIESRLTYSEPLADVTKGNFLNISYRIRYQWNNSDLLTYNLDPFDLSFPIINNSFFKDYEYLEFDPNLSNQFRNKFLTQELQIGYRKVSKSLNLEAGLLFSPSSSKSIDLVNSERNIPEKWVYNISPFANIRWKFAERSSLRINYRARTSRPSMSQLQPVANVSDPLNIVIGNPDLKPTFTQNIMANFNDFRMESQQSVALMFNTSYALNTIVSQTISNPETGGRTTTYSNVNGNLNIFFMGMLSRPFNNRKWRFNVRLNTRFASTPGYINGDFNRTGNLNLSPSGGITFSADIFQMSVNPNYGFGSIHNSLKDQKDRITHSYGFSSDMSLFFPFGLDFTTDLNFSKTSGLSAGYNSAQWLWNINFSYSFLSDKSLTLSLKAYDILSQRKNITRSVSASAIVDSRFNDLTRYFLLSLTWNFNTLSKKKANMEEEDFPPMPVDGRPFERSGRNSERRFGPPSGGGFPPR